MSIRSGSTGTVLWDQIAAAWAAKTYALDLLVNLKFTVPLVCRAKTIFIMHGSEWFVIPEAFRWHDRQYFRVAVPLYCRHADAIVTADGSFCCRGCESVYSILKAHQLSEDERKKLAEQERSIRAQLAKEIALQQHAPGVRRSHRRGARDAASGLAHARRRDPGARRKAPGPHPRSLRDPGGRGRVAASVLMLALLWAMPLQPAAADHDDGWYELPSHANWDHGDLSVLIVPPAHGQIWNAAELAREHARAFVEHCGARLDAYRAERGRPGVITCALDTELLGHWWWEGPAWLQSVIAAARGHHVELVTLSQALDRHDPEPREDDAQDEKEQYDYESGSSTTDPDSDAIIKVLLDHGVDFVVIGASAALLQGVPIAATLDLDVTAATTKANLKRLESALAELDATLRVPDPEDVVKVDALLARSGRGRVGEREPRHREHLPRPRRQGSPRSSSGSTRPPARPT